MKRRIQKKGKFIFRRLKKSDRTFMLKESYSMAYFEITNRKAYIIKMRGTNNVIYCSQKKQEALRLLNFLNKIKL